MNRTEAVLKFSGAALFDLKYDFELNNSDYPELLSVAEKNSIVGIIRTGIHKSGVSVNQESLSAFDRESEKEIYQYLMQKNELPVICAALEKAKIPHMVLKGSIMRRYYPEEYLRTSCDIDILVQSDEETKLNVMQRIGYRYDKDGGVTMNFKKSNVLAVELHKNLFDEKTDYNDYFDKVWDRVIPVDGKEYEYRMTEEDFYAYMIAHFAKHFSKYGSGIRNAFDIYIYNRFAPKEFDRPKAERILDDIGLLKFEKSILHLTQTWFDGATPTQDDRKVTDYILGSGIYGNTKIQNAIKLKNSGNMTRHKLARNFHFVIPEYRVMKNQFPVLEKAPVLLPVCWAARWMRIFTPKRKKAIDSLNLYNSIDKDYTDYVSYIFEQIGLK